MITITKDRVVDNGKHEAQRAVLRDVQDAIGEMIEDVRGTTRLEISLTLTQGDVDDTHSAEKTPGSDNSADQSSQNTRSKNRTNSKNRKSQKPAKNSNKPDIKPEQTLEQDEDPLKAIAAETLEDDGKNGRDDS